MSYIRCLGNPDGMYAWASCSGSGEVAEIVADRHEGIVSLPRYVFERLMIKWADMHYAWDDPIKYRGAVFTQTPADPANGIPTNFSHWTLTWGDKKVTAWEVTWSYVAENVINRYRNRYARRRTK